MKLAICLVVSLLVVQTFCQRGYYVFDSYDDRGVWNHRPSGNRGYKPQPRPVRPSYEKPLSPRPVRPPPNPDQGFGAKEYDPEFSGAVSLPGGK